jgi:hypothetical protein
MDTHTIIEELLEMAFSITSVLMLYNETRPTADSQR